MTNRTRCDKCFRVLRQLLVIGNKVENVNGQYTGKYCHKLLTDLLHC